MITAAAFSSFGVIIGLAGFGLLILSFYGSYVQTIIFGITCASFLTRGYERVDWIGLSIRPCFSMVGQCFIFFISALIWLNDRLALQEVLDVAAPNYVPSISRFFSFFANTQLFDPTHSFAESLGCQQIALDGHLVHVSYLSSDIHLGLDPLSTPLPHVLTFLGGINPITASLWLTDIAHHHVAIIVVFLVAGHLYLPQDEWLVTTILPVATPAEAVSLTYPLIVAGNRGRGQFYPDGTTSNLVAGWVNRIHISREPKISTWTTITRIVCTCSGPSNDIHLGLDPLSTPLPHVLTFLGGSNPMPASLWLTELGLGSIAWVGHLGHVFTFLGW